MRISHLTGDCFAKTARNDMAEQLPFDIRGWSLTAQSAGWDRPPAVYNIDMSNDTVEVLNEITDIEIIAVGNSIRDLDRLQKKHGRGRWRKLKGFANVRLPDNTTCFAEIHWYEAHGIGKRDIKVKRILGK